MALRFFILLVIIVRGADGDSFALKKETGGNSEHLFTNSDQGQEAGEEGNDNFPEFKKVAEFLRPLVAHVENRKCQKQLETLVKSLQNSSLWAVQMVDASAKIPNGLLTSDAYELGNYDACIEINLKRAREDNVLGKYCLVDFSTEKLKISPSTDEGETDALQPWEKLMIPIFNYGFVNNLCRAAVCVPNECSPQDVENVFRFLFNKTSRRLKREVEIGVLETSCSTASGDESAGVILVKRITPLVFLWVGVITVFDLLGWFPASESSRMKRIIVNFSAYKNYKILTRSDCPEPVRAVNSLKVYAVIFLVATRRASLFLAGPTINRKHVDQAFDETFKETFFAICNNVVADTFLVLDGFLHFHGAFTRCRKNPRENIFRVYVFHFLNACPLYIAAMLFYAHVFETVGTGPMWKERTGKLIENCKQNWLINLVNLNNFLKVNDMCVFQSWHFAVVAQCFLIVPALAKITQKPSTPGTIVFKLLIAAAFAVPIVKLCYSSESLDGLPHEDGNVYWHQRLSTNTFNRAAAYFIGNLSSLIYLRMGKSKVKFLKTCGETPFKAAVGIWFVGLCAQPILTRMPPSQKAFTFFSRQIVWSLFIIYLVLGNSTKRLTGRTPLITGKYLLPLGRLSFSYLLVVDLVQIYSIGIMRALDYFSLSRMVWISSADLLATYAVAFVFYMIVHRPVSNILHETFAGT